MMGATHGLAGVLTGALIATAASNAGTQLEPESIAAVITAATLAAELPDLDTSQSRISRGSSTLTAIPAVRLLALPITLPLVIAGAAIRATGVPHRGATHSPAAALLWALAIVPAYALYLRALTAATTALTAHAGAPGAATEQLQHLGDAATATWAATGPLAALAVLAGYSTHLLLDALTKDTQQLAWPLTRRGYTLTRPSIGVGGRSETLLIALPLALAVTAITAHHLQLPALDQRQLTPPSLSTHQPTKEVTP